MFDFAKSKTLVAAILPVAILATATMPASAKDSSKPVRLVKETSRNGTVYCMSERITGSIMPVKTCLSKAEWTARGAQLGDDESATSNAGKATKVSDGNPG